MNMYVGRHRAGFRGPYRGAHRAPSRLLLNLAALSSLFVGKAT